MSRKSPSCEYFYCLNRNQLSQYWKCVVEDHVFFCPSRCDRCSVCKEISDIFSELHNSFFYPKTAVANNHDEILYQSALWRIFTSILDKRNKRFIIETAKSIPNSGLVLTMGRQVNRSFICFLVKNYYLDKQNYHKLCHCYNCKRLDSLLSQMERWSFYELNRFHDKWFIIFHRKFECQIASSFYLKKCLKK